MEEFMRENSSLVLSMARETSPMQVETRREDCGLKAGEPSGCKPVAVADLVPMTDICSNFKLLTYSVLKLKVNFKNWWPIAHTNIY
jgi:hypothetical protein